MGLFINPHYVDVENKAVLVSHAEATNKAGGNVILRSLCCRLEANAP